MGRNILEIMCVLHLCLEQITLIYASKKGYELGDNINAKVLALDFELFAELESNLITQRTRRIWQD